jgi:hypothetical protein
MTLACFQEFVSQTTAGDKAAADPLAAGFDPQTRGQMGFASAALPQEAIRLILKGFHLDLKWLTGISSLFLGFLSQTKPR